MRQPQSIVTILIESHEGLLLKKGVPAARAHDEAERAVRELLSLVGGQKWHLPRKIKEEALEVRNDAIRAAHRRGVNRREIQRAFHIGTTRFYEILKAGHAEAGPLQDVG